MGLFEKLFPPKARTPTEREVQSYFKTLTAYQPVYTTYEGGLYEMALTRAAIATFARHASKLHLEIVGDRRPIWAIPSPTSPILGRTRANFWRGWRPSTRSKTTLLSSHWRTQTGG